MGGRSGERPDIIRVSVDKAGVRVCCSQVHFPTGDFVVIVSVLDCTSFFLSHCWGSLVPGHSVPLDVNSNERMRYRSQNAELILNPLVV